MAFCRTCGQELQPDARFCAECGTVVLAAGAQQEQPTYAQPNYEAQSQPAAAPVEPAEDKHALSVGAITMFSYYGIFFFIPLVAAATKGSAFARFHANQGLLILLMGVASGILALIPYLGAVLTAIIGIANIVFVIMGIVSVCRGEMKKMPLIGDIKIIK
ncbi:zinc-ribbon domain-containing protein [Christensenellaceae bacterium OttesenSCG-928-L17]|nr:zinc-ribbon domain-containing protein [Christensenellaceae bacterium OttesenSCG-928-L17]